MTLDSKQYLFTSEWLIAIVSIMKKEWIVDSPTDLQLIAREILENHQAHLAEPLVICLQGDLGAGKTAFTQELGKLLGVSEVITSPTFTIMKQYQTTHPQWQILVHIDAYRLESEAETKPLHIAQIVSQPNTISCIEWPEIIPTSIPDSAYQVQIDILKDEQRRVTITLGKEQ
jgi:tRNA threonylcarbamoyladenosine biosynthesis protein TsaE